MKKFNRYSIGVYTGTGFYDFNIEKPLTRKQSMTKIAKFKKEDGKDLQLDYAIILNNDNDNLGSIHHEDERIIKIK